MTGLNQNEVTQLIEQVREGESGALDRLVAVVYDELRDMAHRKLAYRRPGETLNTTALVHEAFLKLARHDDPDWTDRAHFFRAASQAMRHIIVDEARRRKTAKHGGELSKSDLALDAILTPQKTDDVLALDESLSILSEMDARQAEIVELRYFVGFTIEETADVLGLSPATVKREWSTARAWLHQSMSRS